MAGETATASETAKQLVQEIVAELPFEDDPTTFLATLVALAEAHGMDGEE